MATWGALSSTPARLLLEMKMTPTELRARKRYKRAYDEMDQITERVRELQQRLRKTGARIDKIAQ